MTFLLVHNHGRAMSFSDIMSVMAMSHNNSKQEEMLSYSVLMKYDRVRHLGRDGDRKECRDGEDVRDPPVLAMVVEGWLDKGEELLKTFSFLPSFNCKKEFID